MRVPLLLGEDFQTTYEIGLERFASGHSEIQIGRNPARVINASSAACVDLGFEIRQAFLAQPFVRSKASRRAKARIHNDKSFANAPVLATTDVLIAGGKVCCVPVKAAFGDQDIWLVEKILIGTDTADILAAPTTFILASNPYIPIANPGSRPWYIRSGDIVGHLIDPVTLDNPANEDLNRYAAAADGIRAVITGTL
jgi:hypothetical protein